ncbi:MAG: TIGR00730 family Rossman fold protein [Spirochaetaceae bacterium]|nr:MAG: TIGR00730 family Rossman fold protein [Spirochaetaceae bacterium]
MKAVCVFCGAAAGFSAVYANAARSLVRELVRREITIVYGGGKVGLMGIVAMTAIEEGGRVVGVIPENLFEKEIAYGDVAELHVTGSMSERKARMAELSDGFIALPGGLGTLEEFSEVLSWAQIGLHAKPCGILNVAGFYDGLIAFLDQAVEHGFVRPESRRLAIVHSEAAALIDAISAAPQMLYDRWA